MNALRINDGDIIIVRRQEEVEQGEVAVVLVDEEDTGGIHIRVFDIIVQICGKSGLQRVGIP